jgi:hypothetical protein
MRPMREAAFASRAQAGIIEGSLFLRVDAVIGSDARCAKKIVNIGPVCIEGVAPDLTGTVRKDRYRPKR